MARLKALRCQGFTRSGRACLNAPSYVVVGRYGTHHGWFCKIHADEQLDLVTRSEAYQDLLQYQGIRASTDFDGTVFNGVNI